MCCSCPSCSSLAALQATVQVLVCSCVRLELQCHTDVTACSRLSISACCLCACRITLPPAVHEAAAAKGKPADWLYCSELLEQTGIVVVPGGCILVLGAAGTGLGCSHNA